MKNGNYEIIAGERRWRASKLAGLSEIPSIIMEADEVQSAQMALIENVQREDLNAYEEAKAYKALVDDFGMSQEDVAKKVGKSRPAVANSMRLLDLPPDVADLLISEALSAGHCRALLALNDKREMLPLALKAVKKNYSVREIESAVRKINAGPAEKAETEEGVSVDYYAELERRARDMSGRRIKIVSSKNVKTVQIEWTDGNDLENILSAVCGKSVIEEE